MRTTDFNPPPGSPLGAPRTNFRTRNEATVPRPTPPPIVKGAAPEDHERKSRLKLNRASPPNQTTVNATRRPMIRSNNGLRRVAVAGLPHRWNPSRKKLTTASAPIQARIGNQRRRVSSIGHSLLASGYPSSAPSLLASSV